MRLNKFILIVSMAALFLSQKVFAGEQEYNIDRDRSVVEFNFKSTLHGVQGHAEKFSGLVVADMEGPVIIKRGKVSFDVLSMDTGEPQRDENMRKMLEADQFPLITFDILNASSVKEGGMVIHGQLTVRNVTLPIDLHADAQKTDGGFVLSGETPLSLKKLSLRPPSVMMLIRVFDRVDVKFKVFLKEKI